jgi:hypothetical protein
VPTAVSAPERIVKTLGQRAVRLDFAFSIGFFLAGFVLCLLGCALIHPAITRFNDIWFDADSARYFNAMHLRWQGQERTSVHPLASLIMYPPVWMLRTVLHLSVNRAEQLTLGLLAGLWLSLLYQLFRALRCRRLDSAILTAMASTCASAIFLFPVTEAHPFAAVSVILGLLFAASRRARWQGSGWYVAQGVVSASMITTNWMYGVLTSLFAKGWKDLPVGQPVHSSGIRRAVYPASPYGASASRGAVILSVSRDAAGRSRQGSFLPGVPDRFRVAAVPRAVRPKLLAGCRIAARCACRRHLGRSARRRIPCVAHCPA